MRFDWDPEKGRANRAKHGMSFEEASEVFTRGEGVLEIYDAAHSIEEDRFIAMGMIPRGLVVVVFTEREDDVTRILSARDATPAERSRWLTYWKHENGR